jgi:hypothetical protein
MSRLIWSVSRLIGRCRLRGTGVAMDALVELEAVEALPLIRRAFELGRIDEMARGGWGDVLDDLGVEPEEGDPLLDESRRRFEERQEQFFPRQRREQLQAALERLSGRNGPFAALAAEAASAPAQASRDAQAQARKHKNKRKLESASRKANRRRRK